MVGQGLRPGVFFSNSNIFPFSEYEHRRSELARYASSYGLEIVDDDYNHSAWLSSVKGLEREPERGLRCLECFKFRLLRAASYASSHGYRVLTTTLASSRWKNLKQVDEAGRFACDTVNYRNSAYAVCCGSGERADELLSVRPVFHPGFPEAGKGQNSALAASYAAPEAEIARNSALGTAIVSSDQTVSPNISPNVTEVIWWGQNWRKGGLQDRRSCLIRERSLYNQTYCGCEFGHSSIPNVVSASLSKLSNSH